MTDADYLRRLEDDIADLRIAALHTPEAIAFYRRRLDRLEFLQAHRQRSRRLDETDDLMNLTEHVERVSDLCETFKVAGEGNGNDSWGNRMDRLCDVVQHGKVDESEAQSDVDDNHGDQKLKLTGGVWCV